MSKVNIAAFAILATMLALMIASIWNESAIIDELAHIPAGYGYVLHQDFRLNPEHPPLLKVFAGAVSALVTRSHFPTDTRAWRDDINGQWDQGSVFLYESGNDADALIFWARIPLILLATFFGGLLFFWTKKRFGNLAAILVLLFFAFSPTILTHSRYVTTDMGAAFGFFLGIIALIKFLEMPTWKNAVLLGLAFGLAQLLKFSLVILVPLYGLLLVLWVLSLPNLHLHERFRVFGRLMLKMIGAALVALGLIWVVYGVFTWNYPPERQSRDTKAILTSYRSRALADFNIKLVENPVTRPLAQYILGILMVDQRQAGGNTQFFMGEVSNRGFRSYFPLLYAYKEPLALHILTLIALWFAIWKTVRSEKRWSFTSRIRAWINDHFAEFSGLVFIFIYWALSISSPLNIGIRHVLPTFPFIFLLVSRQIAEWLHSHESSNPKTWLSWLSNIYELYIKTIPKYLFIGFCVLWLIISTLSAFPNFMTYYNEAGGGPDKGYEIAVDSNYDWGQDLKRLHDYVKSQGIDKIAIDYFGGGQPKYYFGEGNFGNWQSSKGPAHGWFAISATFRQSTFGTPTHGFVRKPEDSYEWLQSYTPAARIGSIFVYKLP